MAKKMVSVKELKFFAKSNLNVLLSGKHGVGKTALIKETFNDQFGPLNVNWRYFSASTLDPWVDLVGIPKTYKTETGEDRFKIVPPEHFTGTDEIYAIFFDEINRAPEKVMNAVMELIQFKSINGRKFPNLRCVWAAENPSDDEDYEYMVQKLDPAQRDRFQIQVTIPYEINVDYFKKRHGEKYTDIAKKWWKDNKKIISPRKLDDILSGFAGKIDPQFFSNEVNLKELAVNLGAQRYYDEDLKPFLEAPTPMNAKKVNIQKLRENSSCINTNMNTDGLKFRGEHVEYLGDEVMSYVKRVFPFVDDRSNVLDGSEGNSQVNEPTNDYRVKKVLGSSFTFKNEQERFMDFSKIATKYGKYVPPSYANLGDLIFVLSRAEKIIEDGIDFDVNKNDMRNFITSYLWVAKEFVSSSIILNGVVDAKTLKKIQANYNKLTSMAQKMSIILSSANNRRIREILFKEKNHTREKLREVDQNIVRLFAE